MEFETFHTIKSSKDDFSDHGLYKSRSLRQKKVENEAFFSKPEAPMSFSLNDSMQNYFTASETKRNGFVVISNDPYTERSFTPTKPNMASKFGTITRVPSTNVGLPPPKFQSLFDAPTAAQQTPILSPLARNTRSSSFAMASYPFGERPPMRPVLQPSVLPQPQLNPYQPEPSTVPAPTTQLETSKSIRNRRKSVSTFIAQLFDKFSQKKDEMPKSARSIKSVKSYNFLSQSADIYNDIIDDYNDVSNLERGRSLVRRPARNRSTSTRIRREGSFGSELRSFDNSDYKTDKDLLPTGYIYDEATNTPFYKDVAEPEDSNSSINTKTTTLRRLRADLDKWWRSKTLTRARKRHHHDVAGGLQPNSAELVYEKTGFEATSTPVKEYREGQEVLMSKDKYGSAVRNVIETRILVVENEPNMEEVLRQGKTAAEWLKADLINLIQNGNLKIFKEKSGRNFITIEVTDLPEL
ncbi:hypothetical protein OGAPHI_005319 [Ogataea philodendri]|uniref:Uncharacterized protein n=1 Tax=Ogataea philodendri TaxID=1378263 RepID=A0A9P8P272_9ASCO|nr:uncharacterized protein OGAPHI_005319 [Ogataea philodendri]KAH3663329.1 hypothetical protein OGAPHI_005319 [Ogataea philodendri]